jgi:hypothetical protein
MRYRAVGLHLLTARDRTEMDCQQLKSHAEEVEAALEQEKAAWGQKQGAIEEQLKEIRVSRPCAHTYGRGTLSWLDGYR